MDLILFFVLGTVFGSFFNVLAMSLVTGENYGSNRKRIISGRSHCPACNHQLHLVDLVPIFSYLFLRGRCRYCKSSISPLYVCGELMAGTTFAALFYITGWDPELLVHLTLGSLLVISSITDIKEKLVLNEVLLVFAGILLVLRVILYLSLELSFLYYLGSGIFMFVLLMAVMILIGNKLGGGDVKLYAVIGLTIGILDAFASLFFASVIGLIIMIPGMIIGKVDRKTEIPFVPFIWAGVLITYYVDVVDYLL